MAYLRAALCTHVSLLQKRQDLGNVVKSENTMGGLLESMKLNNHSEREMNSQEKQMDSFFIAGEGANIIHNMVLLYVN